MYRPNPLAVQQLAASPQMAAFLGGVADDAAGEAQRLLPYPNILGGITIRGETTVGADGAEGQVVIDGPGWHLWEFGTVNHAPRPAIRPGVQSAISRVGGRWRAT